MRKALLLIGPLFGLTLAAAPESVAAADEDLTRNVLALVLQLNHAELATREQAEKKLVELGPDVLDILPAVLADRQVASIRNRSEMNKRLAHVRSALEESLAQSTSVASRVTLRGDAITLSDALAAIEKQTGNKLLDLRPKELQSDPKLRIDFDKTSFWQALDDVLDQAGLTVDPWATVAGKSDGGKPRGASSVDALALVARPTGQRSRRTSAAYNGPFRVEVTALRASRDLRGGGNHLKLTLEVAWEPRLAIIELSQATDAIKALAAGPDGRMLPLKSIHAGARLDASIVSGAKAVRFELPLELPPREAKSLASLSGKLKLLLPGRLESLRFDLGRRETTQQQERGDMLIKLKTQPARDKLLVATLVYFNAQAGAVQSHFGWIYDNRAYIEGPDKKPLAAVDFASGGFEGGDAGIAATYTFAAPRDLAGYTFVYQTPVVMIPLEIEYELKDLELP